MKSVISQTDPPPVIKPSPLDALDLIEVDQAQDDGKAQKLYRVHITDLANDNELSPSASKALAKAMHQLGVTKAQAEQDVAVIRRVAELEPDAMDSRERINAIGDTVAAAVQEIKDLEKKIIQCRGRIAQGGPDQERISSSVQTIKQLKALNPHLFDSE